jgi:hypothetical protein
LKENCHLPERAPGPSLEFMIRLVGYAFTETPLIELKSLGLDPLSQETFDPDIFVGHVFRFRDTHGFLQEFEIRQIKDEQAYLTQTKKKNFHPFFVEAEPRSDVPLGFSSLYSWHGPLTASSTAFPELVTYLKVRKSTEELALILKRNETYDTLTEYKQGLQDYTQNLLMDGQQLQLLHLGPSCFDIILTT